MLSGPIYMLQVYDRVLGSRSEATLIALTMLVAFLYGMMGLLDFARGRIMGRVGRSTQIRGYRWGILQPHQNTTPLFAIRDAWFERVFSFAERIDPWRDDHRINPNGTRTGTD